MPHTPGPWEASEVGDYADFDGQSRVVSGDDMRICAVHAGGSNADENEANAKLIIAAPDLLDACERALTLLDQDEKALPPLRSVRAYLRDAIAKATT